MHVPWKESVSLEKVIKEIVHSFLTSLTWHCNCSPLRFCSSKSGHKRSFGCFFLPVLKKNLLVLLPLCGFLNKSLHSSRPSFICLCKYIETLGTCFLCTWQFVVDLNNNAEAVLYLMNQGCHWIVAYFWSENKAESLSVVELSILNELLHSLAIFLFFFPHQDATSQHGS